MMELFTNSLINILCSRKYVLLLKDKKKAEQRANGSPFVFGFRSHVTNDK